MVHGDTGAGTCGDVPPTFGVVKPSATGLASPKIRAKIGLGYQSL